MRCRRSAAVSGTLFQGGTFWFCPGRKGRSVLPLQG